MFSMQLTSQAFSAKCKSPTSLEYIILTILKRMRTSSNEVIPLLIVSRLYANAMVIVNHLCKTICGPMDDCQI